MGVFLTCCSDRFPLKEVCKNNCSSITIVLNAFLILGALFIILASHQILPQGINAMGQLGMTGQIIGYVGLLTGIVLLTLLTCLKTGKKSHIEVSSIVQKTNGEATSSPTITEKLIKAAQKKYQNSSSFPYEIEFYEKTYTIGNEIAEFNMLKKFYEEVTQSRILKRVDKQQLFGEKFNRLPLTSSVLTKNPYFKPNPCELQVYNLLSELVEIIEFATSVERSLYLGPKKMSESRNDNNLKITYLNGIIEEFVLEKSSIKIGKIIYSNGDEMPVPAYFEGTRTYPDGTVEKGLFDAASRKLYSEP